VNSSLEKYAVLREKLSYYDDQIIEQIIKQLRFREKNHSAFERLTNREVDILSHIADGYSNPMVAEELNISRRTVETHRARINEKLEITSYADLVKFALAFDLISY
jgi:DNA-binding NarL/FixJ family response regulator